MSVASLGTTISAALNQAQSLLQGHHAHKTAQSGGADLLAQITAQLTGQTAGGQTAGGQTAGGQTAGGQTAGGQMASGSTPAATNGGFSASLGQLGTDVLSMLGIGGGGTSSPGAAASAYAASQNSI